MAEVRRVRFKHATPLQMGLLIVIVIAAILAVLLFLHNVGSHDRTLEGSHPLTNSSQRGSSSGGTNGLNQPDTDTRPSPSGTGPGSTNSLLGPGNH